MIILFYNFDIEGKSVRRRAASMETSSSKYEKRRGRAKKRVEALRNAGVTGIYNYFLLY